MTAEEIIERVRPLDLNLSVENGEVWFSVGFSIDPDYEEPHDRAWSIACDIQEQLEVLGLKADPRESDHDTVWGRIVPMEARDG